MKKIILTLLIATGILTTGNLALADSSLVFITPTETTSTVGNSFDASVKVDPKNGKVCVVEGTISFNNLTCKNITVGAGLIAQTTPTCSAPNFTLGIPKCATDIRDIFTVSVSGNTDGEASIALSNVKVVGEGEDTPFSLQNGNYGIVSPLITLPVINPIYKPVIINTNKDIPVLSTSSISTTTSTSTDEAQSKFSRLTASAFDAMNSAINFFRQNLTGVMLLGIILLAISQVFLWLRILKKNE